LLDGFPETRLWFRRGTAESGFIRNVVLTARYVVSEPSKSSSARGGSGAKKKSGGQSSAGRKSSGDTARKSGKARTKSELEQELAELKKVNAELQQELRERKAEAERLARINEQAGQRIDKVISRIKTLLAS